MNKADDFCFEDTVWRGGGSCWRRRFLFVSHVSASKLDVEKKQVEGVLSKKERVCWSWSPSRPSAGRGTD
ncbi:hypothetical protein PHYPO_G00117750 [Pangasianodon hypophthalmus]|uniref:Uncharacterized protein n=1 Tax=Pangasianodon hypophthalmus TaxID=310915 RepID=A0A5N5KZW5_PANHP|nr:hypothetical protein PHYPO_G00117750 [Pangasianodon hypophthalmus]